MPISVSQHHVELVAKTAQYEAGMRSSAAASHLLAVEQGRAAAAAQTGSKAASRFGVVAQQAGYQVQDFAVQVAAGQNAMVALAQQGSQMLGVFGAGGAIAGAVLTVGILAYRLLGVGDAAKKSTPEIDTLADSFKRLGEARYDAFYGKSDMPVKSRILAGDFDKSIKNEERLNQERAYGYELLQKVKDLGSLDRITLFPSKQNRDAYAKAITEGKNVTAADFGGKMYGAGDASALAENMILTAQENINKEKYARIAIEGKIAELNKQNFEIEAERVSQSEKERQERWRAFADARKQNELDSMSNDDKLAYYIKEMKFLDSIGERQSAEYEIAKKRARDLGTTLLGQSGPSKEDIKDYSRYEKTVREMQSRIPQALQVNTGTSAFGGMVGSGTANQIIDIQKGILDGIRQLVRMEMLAGAN